MYTHQKITPERFSERFCSVAKYLNFQRIGPFEKFLNNLQPHTKLSYGLKHVRVATLKNELKTYLI